MTSAREFIKGLLSSLTAWGIATTKKANMGSTKANVLPYFF